MRLPSSACVVQGTRAQPSEGWDRRSTRRAGTKYVDAPKRLKDRSDVAAGCVDSPDIHSKLWVCGEVGRSRLPVTEQLAGSNPVIPAMGASSKWLG